MEEIRKDLEDFDRRLSKFLSLNESTLGRTKAIEEFMKEELGDRTEVLSMVESMATQLRGRAKDMDPATLQTEAATSVASATRANNVSVYDSDIASAANDEGCFQLPPMDQTDAFLEEARRNIRKIVSNTSGTEGRTKAIEGFLKEMRSQQATDSAILASNNSVIRTKTMEEEIETIAKGQTMISEQIDMLAKGQTVISEGQTTISEQIDTLAKGQTMISEKINIILEMLTKGDLEKEMDALKRENEVLLHNQMLRAQIGALEKENANLRKKAMETASILSDSSNAVPATAATTRSEKRKGSRMRITN